MKVQRFVIMLVLVVVLSACNDNPCANACGLTSPLTSVEQAVMDAIQPNQQNLLSGGN